MLGEKDRYRGGFLSQAGFMLMTTNNGEYTNPFYRGAWVLKSFYGDHLETPADLEIATLQSADNNGDHQANDRCASRECQLQRLPQEDGSAWNRIGELRRIRTLEGPVHRRQQLFHEQRRKAARDVSPVDTRTVHMDGRTFEGPIGLKKILMEDKETFSRAFVENMLSYALARQLTFHDRKNLDQLYQRSADTDFRLRDILLAIVSSDYFTKR